MKKDIPVTPAIRELKSAAIEFIPHIYDYKDKGGTAQTSEELQVEEHNVIKTLIMEGDGGELFAVLMHGDKEVSLKELARQLNIKKAAPADAKKAGKATGYLFGGTSPFGLRQKLKIYAQVTIFDLSVIYINGGKQGFILEMNPADLKKLLNLTEIDAAI